MNYYKVISLLICTMIAATLAARSSADIYRWVDEDGQVHFGDKPESGSYDVIEQKPSPIKPAKPEQPEAVSDDAVIEEKSEDKARAKEQDKAETDENSEATKTNQDEGVVDEVEKARQDRIKALEKLTEELRITREAREKKRETKKQELKSLRKGCAKAQQRITFLQSQIDRYINSQLQGSNLRKPEEVILDTKRQRIVAELQSRREYVSENCNDL